MSEIFKKIIHKEKSDSASYIEHLKGIGVTIGEGTKIYDPVNTHIDEYRPYLITIGKNCKIAKGVTILSHSGDWFVAQSMYGDVVGSADEVCIGDNVFIGMNVTILKGVHIGDNVIIGANSLVHGNLQGGYVYVGVPAKPICTIEEHHKKTLNIQLSQALTIYKNYVRVFNEEPTINEFREFFFLFCERGKPLPETLSVALSLQGNYQFSLNKFLNTTPKFNGFDKFLEWCREQQ